MDGKNFLGLIPVEPGQKVTCDYLTEIITTLKGHNLSPRLKIDSHNIDNTAKKRRPVHSILLGPEIFIVEHLTNLVALPFNGFSFTALPNKLKRMGTFPVRAISKIYE